MKGQCLCSAVTFTADEVETDHHACHCGMCRRWSGGAPLLCTATKSVVFQGEENITRFESSSWAERGFCKTCGTALFYYLKPTRAYLMAIGSFDDQTRFQLTREIFIDRKPPGYAFVGDHPRWTEEETFARLTPPST
jgi:hypothetical protein